MLTDEEIIVNFQSKLGEVPNNHDLDYYRSCTMEEFLIKLDKRLAIKNDPTFARRLAANYRAYMKASEEERKNWISPKPIGMTKE